VIGSNAGMGPRRRGPIAVLALGTAWIALLGASACGAADADDGTASAPRSSPSLPPGEVTPASMRPNEVAPERAVDLRPLPWHRAERLGRRRLRIHATLDGGPPCSVLGRVAVKETAREIIVSLWAGRRPGARCDGRQAAVAMPIVVTVDLRAPVADRAIHDGSRRP
jgi:hypothetical protein